LILLDKVNRSFSLVLAALGADPRARPNGALSLQALQNDSTSLHPFMVRSVDGRMTGQLPS
jgi:hypothetical protein